MVNCDRSLFLAVVIAVSLVAPGAHAEGPEASSTAPAPPVGEPEAVAAPPRAERSPILTVGERGVAFTSADGAYELRPRLVLQGDARLFVDDHHKLTDQFLFRRARLYVEGKVARVVTFRLMPDFGEGKTVLYDAWVNVRALDELQLRVGKAKPPFSLERLQSDTAVILGERGQAASLAPNRDIGAELHGDLWGGLAEWSLGVFNGVPDGGLSDGDQDDSKEVAGRLAVGPFARSGNKALEGLRIGFGLTRGDKTGTPQNPYLPTYKSFGQNTFFAYSQDTTAPTPANTTVASGLHARVAAHAYWPVGPLGLLGEVVWTRERVARGPEDRLLQNVAWNTTASFVVTGEDASFEGVTPKRNFDLAAGAFGAVELAARATALHVDHHAFPVFADESKVARNAFELAAGVNWVPLPSLKLVADYAHTTFQGGAAAGGARDAENVVLLRTQLAY